MLVEALAACSGAAPRHRALAAPAPRHPVIHVFVLSSFPDRQRRALVDSLRHHYPWCRYDGVVPLPESAYYAPNHRYRAIAIDNFLSTLRRRRDYAVALTSVDISAPLHGYADYGIFGMGYPLGGHNAVFSNFRIHSTPQLFKLMQHEIAHSFGLPHCKNFCIMQDAERQNKFSYLQGFCPRCKARLQNLGWKY